MRGMMQLGEVRERLLRDGIVVPAHPLALTEGGTLDENRQRALTRYYAAAGAGGIAVAVHTTQFEIRLPQHGLLRPVLELASSTWDAEVGGRPSLKIAGVVGPTAQAVAEAELARELGYDAVLLSPGGLPDHTERQLLDRATAVGEVLPVFGFYLQEAVGGRYLSPGFWQGLADQESTVAVKAAPFDRYRTLELVQGVAASDRGSDVILYTGNDDNIVGDLTSEFRVAGPGGRLVDRRFVGGLLGHWAVWTRSAVRLLELVRLHWAGDVPASRDVAALSAGITDANAAVFDSRNHFAGVIAGVHEVLRRQGLMRSNRCLNPAEKLSPGQSELITRATSTYHWLREEDDFIAEHLDRWLK